ncbi:GPI-anchored surface protein, putative [Bodo saltans]|uniref:GPI-anchored surface protein, putative n=1 Tax=Bodo saltans TaxID=75058 RepID=A0A0S4IR86_BODSA|nr:GPI-anchored surface protein, putative [Bodo saltans]|eukprot:CUG01037.1 GPI-anchored surface protein, putative [Bodo saltans]
MFFVAVATIALLYSGVSLIGKLLSEPNDISTVPPPKGFASDTPAVPLGTHDDGAAPSTRNGPQQSSSTTTTTPLITASTTSANHAGWSIDYLPPIMNSMVQYHKGSSLVANSLEAMRPPAEYHGLTCPQLVQRHMTEYAQVASRIDFTRPPKYKMPWYFHDPYALCGRYLLTHHQRDFQQDVAHPPQLLHRVAVRQPAQGGETSDSQMVVARVAAGEWSNGDVYVEHCGQCAEVVSVGESAALKCAGDVLMLARLISDQTVVSADVQALVVPANGRPYHPLRFFIRQPGEYVLEVTLVHVNGSSSNVSWPRSMGVIGIRASDHNKKSFKYNLACDLQRHVYGSPLKVLALGRGAAIENVNSLNLKPLCNVHNYNQTIGSGHWVRVPYKTRCEAFQSGSICSGDPTWLTDACGFNNELVWSPDSCRMRVYSPPLGPQQSCLKRGRSGFLLFVGDSVAREYVQNCRLFDLRSSKLHCIFANIALEGQHYSLDYAKAVVKAMIDSLKQNRPGVLATNLGIHHMIGKSSTEQWIEFIDVFIAAWKAEAFQILPVGTDQWLLEKAVWLGPPTIHYARHGMGHQRAVLWDEIAWKKLEPLGFIRLYAIAPTLSRTEATWDGLHYASYKGKVQSPWRNRAAPVLLWNGGVSNMLFNVLLNLICDPIPT